ncbi:hypothetical protein KBD69_02325 [Candidatus Woesebacteria bacterium]|nr:hypothetical protein [Candidatus Woesebacteria bacterium]
MAQRRGEALSHKQHQALMNHAVGYYARSKKNTISKLKLGENGRAIQGIIVPGSMGGGVGDKRPPMTDSDFDGKVVISAEFERSDLDLELIASVLWSGFATLMKEKMEVNSYFPFTLDDMQSLQYYFATTRYRHNGLSVICERESVVYQSLKEVGNIERFIVTPYFVD